MNPNSSPRRIHVERTLEPAVLRWVCHHPVLASASPGRRRPEPDGPLGALMVDGSISEIVVNHGDVNVRVASVEDWPTIVPLVQAALVAELDSLDAWDGLAGAHWLISAVDGGGVTPTIPEVQRVVDRAAGMAMAGHGGAMIVTSVDTTTVRLRPEGACDGCHQSDTTVLGLIEPALRAAYPQLVTVALDDVAQRPSPLPFQRVRAPKRRVKGNIDRSCH